MTSHRRRRWPEGSAREADLRETVATIFGDGWSRGEVEVFSTTLADSVLFDYAGSPREMSRADMTAVVLRWREAFPDLRMEVHGLRRQLGINGRREGRWSTRPRPRSGST